MSLKDSAIKGLIWSSIDTGGVYLINFISTIFYARLLSPQDFGIYALISIFIVILDTILKGGLIETLVRKKVLNENDLSTVFVYNITVAFLLFIFITIFSPFISNYFHKSELTSLIRITSIVLLINSVTIVQNIKLTRELNFKSIAKTNNASIFLSTIIGIIFAYLDFKVWSLVIQTILRSFFIGIGYFYFSRWHYRFIFVYRNFKENFSFGYKLVLGSFINLIVTNYISVFIAKTYDIKSLGYFYQAQKFSDLPPRIIHKIFQNVSFPLLSTLNNDNLKLLSTYQKINKILYTISFPLMSFLIINAKPLFYLLFSEKWSESVIMFQILCVGGLVYPNLAISGWLPVILGRSDFFLKLEVIYKTFLVILLLLIYKFSLKIEFVASSYTMIILFQWLINIYIIKKLTGITMKKQFFDAAKVGVVVIVCSLLSLTINFFVHGLSQRLFINSFMFPLIYFFLIAIIDKKFIFEITGHLKQFFNS